jgi:hypothetical protein
MNMENLEIIDLNQHMFKLIGELGQHRGYNAFNHQMITHGDAESADHLGRDSLISVLKDILNNHILVLSCVHVN